MSWNTDDYNEDIEKTKYRVFFKRIKPCFVDIEAESADEAEDMFDEGEYNKDAIEKVRESRNEVSYVREVDECEDGDSEEYGNDED